MRQESQSSNNPPFMESEQADTRTPTGRTSEDAVAEDTARQTGGGGGGGGGGDSRPPPGATSLLGLFTPPPRQSGQVDEGDHTQWNPASSEEGQTIIAATATNSSPITPAPGSMEGAPSSRRERTNNDESWNANWIPLTRPPPQTIEQRSISQELLSHPYSYDTLYRKDTTSGGPAPLATLFSPPSPPPPPPPPPISDDMMNDIPHSPLLLHGPRDAGEFFHDPNHASNHHELLQTPRQSQNIRSWGLLPLTATTSTANTTSPPPENAPLLGTEPGSPIYYVVVDTNSFPDPRSEPQTLKRSRPLLSQPMALHAIKEGSYHPDSMFHKLKTYWSSILLIARKELLSPSTYIGAFMNVMFQIVYALTMGAAITRTHGNRPTLGLFAKIASLGTVLVSPIYWYFLANDIPALYPVCDLFTAPFLANFAVVVDEELYVVAPELAPEESDIYFITTFMVLTVISLCISGGLLVLASVFKLANLGAYIPYPVLCGFFGAVGVLTWTLAFKVDANGRSVEQVFQGFDDWNGIRHCCWHHLPSVILAAVMKYLGPKNPFYVVLVVLTTIAGFHAYMLLAGVPIEDMVEAEWFWSRSDMKYESHGGETLMLKPPQPMGWIICAFQGKVLWSAVVKGLDMAVALGFLYCIRCSLHGPSMKKNVRNLERTVKAPHEDNTKMTAPTTHPQRTKRAEHRRNFSEAIDIENMVTHSTRGLVGGNERTVVMEQAKPTLMPLKDILIIYGYTQYACALIGCFAITPAVNASSTMYVLGAERVAPQLGATILLVGFYMTNFNLVSYIPKPAFSSLLVLAFIDMIGTWIFQSYYKTKQKLEWLVVPLIVVLAFVIGLLQAVFLGLAMSTFLFVASFYRSGVVKYISNGVSVRSTIERPLRDAKWLDHNGDLIQVLVLQNYLFFGNASSILDYIATMFEEPEEEIDPIFIPPVPKVVILDLTLVTGMDTSAVDAFKDIVTLCGRYDCKIFLAGVAPDHRTVMNMGGVKPENNINRSERKLRFFMDLDSAVGKAEDLLLSDESVDYSFSMGSSTPLDNESGFMRALQHIDEQHETTSLKDLAALEKYTKLIELEPGGVLYDSVTCERGLFFVEDGLLKIERTTGVTTTRGGRVATEPRSVFGAANTLNDKKARTGTIGIATAAMKLGDVLGTKERNFRIARVGPGWVIGSIEAVSGIESPADTIAVTNCKLHYISFKTVDEVEKENPLLILSLYKLLSKLMARRQEVTIGQLGTLHSIMSAPALKRPIGRSSSHVVQLSSLYS